MKSFVLLFLVLITTSLTWKPIFRRELKYPLPNVILSASQICGKRICNPGDIGTLLHYTRNPISPDIPETGVTAKKIAASILGRVIPVEDIYTKDFNTCSSSTVSPFTVDDVSNIRFANGNNIDYQRTEKLNINIQAATEANMKELMKLTDDAAKLAKLEAKIKAAYQKVKDKQVDVIGVYSEWGLSEAARDELKKGKKFEECHKYVEDNDNRIILALGLVVFDIKFQQKNLDDLAAEIDTELEKEGLKASLSFTFKRQVTEALSSTSTGVYQVLMIRHAGIKKHRFVEDMPG
ncbi:hypothetical protein DNI29_19415 [Hymenobacter sediminis]|nr:hypothetical protein DNI29_19415 [Hymenobacter sediminis]